MTAPVIYAIQSATPAEKEFWVRTFQNKDVSEEDLATAQTLIRSQGADKRAEQLALEYAAKARACLNGLPPSEIADCLLRLPDFAVNRST